MLVGEREQVNAVLTRHLSRAIIRWKKARGPNAGWQIYYCSSPAPKAGESQTRTQGHSLISEFAEQMDEYGKSNMVSPVPDFKRYKDNEGEGKSSLL